MEHAAHLGSEQFVKVMSPSTSSTIHKKVQHVIKNAEMGSGTYNLDQINARLSEYESCDDGKDDPEAVYLQGLDRFVQLADDSEEIPKLKNKSYSEFKLSWEDWKKIELMHEVLHVSHR
jgi:DUF971 family protein